MKFASPSLLIMVCMPESSAFLAPTNGFRITSSTKGKHLPWAPSAVGVQERGAGSKNDVCHMVAGGRTPFIAGNWKMNPLDLGSAKDLAKKVAEQTTGLTGVEVAVIPPHPFLVPVLEQVKSVSGSHVTVGAQNLYIENQGAFTGAVSTAMLSSVGCTYVLCGHSERRVVFGDSNETVNRKLRKVLDEGLKPILCIGESKEEYESGLNKEVCAVQLGKGLADVTPEEMAKIVIAYEPVWAIGTGLTATPEIAQGVHAHVRSLLAEKYGQGVADTVRIQYGGSVTPETVDELMACPDIDGALVGGASLVPEKFARIVGFSSTVSA